uniref:Kinesin motor domain-containing protein n=1 Tax=Percolomonas cosmopolitus TaxID=63605 RepID=A0A7S1PHJ6_9EUKA|mmetsp:Transcript_5606/g.21093  ORF Transcript_5606/g.21093 Transcript_5606/m.21093 type:complete len:860 (+) Transcript_5606:3-2582(+)
MTSSAHNAFHLSLHIVQPNLPSSSSNQDTSSNLLHHYRNTCLFHGATVSAPNHSKRKPFIVTLPHIFNTTSNVGEEASTQHHDSDEHRGLFRVQLSSVYRAHLALPLLSQHGLLETGQNANWVLYGSERARLCTDILLGNAMGKVQCTPHHHQISSRHQNSIFSLFLMDLFGAHHQCMHQSHNKTLTVNMELLLLFDDKWTDLFKHTNDSLKLRIGKNSRVTVQDATQVQVHSEDDASTLLRDSIDRNHALHQQIVDGTLIVRFHLQLTESRMTNAHNESWTVFEESLERNTHTSTAPSHRLEECIYKLEKDDHSWQFDRETLYSPISSAPPSSAPLTLIQTVTKSTVSFIDLPYTQSSFDKSYRKGWTHIASQQNQSNTAPNARSNALGSFHHVVKALSQKSKFIPYRTSQLCKFLMPVLGGSSHCKFICSVLDDRESIQDTYNTLKFGQQAKSISNTLAKGRQKTRSETNIARMIEMLDGQLKERKTYNEHNHERHVKRDAWHTPSPRKIQDDDDKRLVTPLRMDGIKKRGQNSKASASTARPKLGNHRESKTLVERKVVSARAASHRSKASPYTDHPEISDQDDTLEDSRDVDHEPVRSTSRKISSKHLQQLYGSDQRTLPKHHDLDNSRINDERPFIKTLASPNRYSPRKDRTSPSQPLNGLHEGVQRIVSPLRCVASHNNPISDAARSTNDAHQFMSTNSTDLDYSVDAGKRKRLAKLEKENANLLGIIKKQDEEKVILQAKLRAQSNVIASYQIRNRDMQIELDRKNQSISQLHEKVDSIQNLQGKLLKSITPKEEVDRIREENEDLRRELEVLLSMLHSQEREQKASQNMKKGSRARASTNDASSGARMWRY